jgi:SAM-dependent methyltransferase
VDEAPKIDTTRASIARVYDASGGGKDNYEVDRELHRRAMEIMPDVDGGRIRIRNWLIRVVRFLAGPGGIDQFLDIGSGLPTAENTHEAAQRLNPEAVVVYVDNDPVVIAHGRAILEENEHTHFIAGDLRNPREILQHAVVTKHLDFTRPVALIQSATLHHVEDDENPHEVMAEYVAALPSGSYVALSHFHNPSDGSRLAGLAQSMEDLYRGGLGSGRFRTRAEIEAFLEGLELVEPGLVRLEEWWPDGPRLRPLDDSDHLVLGAVARKP